MIDAAYRKSDMASSIMPYPLVAQQAKSAKYSVTAGHVGGNEASWRGHWNAIICGHLKVALKAMPVTSGCRLRCDGNALLD